MLRDDNSNRLGQQTSSASPPVVTEGAVRSTPAAGNKSFLRMFIGGVALAASLLKLVLWLAAPARPPVVYHPIDVSSRTGEFSRSLSKCEILFPTGQGAVPGINCLKSGGNNSDFGNKTK
jgi:hypothetical protein